MKVVLELKINESKTKIMKIGRRFKANKYITIGEYKFQHVDKFKYLDTTIASDGNRKTEIKE